MSEESAVLLRGDGRGWQVSRERVRYYRGALDPMSPSCFCFFVFVSLFLLRALALCFTSAVIVLTMT